MTAAHVMTHIINESLRDPDVRMSDIATCVAKNNSTSSSTPLLTQSLCYHPAAAGCRFKLLLLALRHEQHCMAAASSQAQSGASVRSAAPSVMRCERILRAALMWGAAPITWYGRWSQAQARYVYANLCVYVNLYVYVYICKRTCICNCTCTCIVTVNVQSQRCCLCAVFPTPRHAPSMVVVVHVSAC